MILSIMLLVSCALATEPAVRTVEHLGDRYTVVTVQLDRGEDVLLYGGKSGGVTFSNARASAEREGRTVTALMNGGMYGKDDGPVGLFISDAKELHPLALGKGEGNFYLQPNGVFWVDATGIAHVTTTPLFPTDHAKATIATQSGPMLLVDGAVHPEFKPASTNLATRNGVGVSADGKTVYLAISQGEVRFHDFATLFRDELRCEDALFLDGVVSKLWTKGKLPTSRYGAVIAVTSKKP